MCILATFTGAVVQCQAEVLYSQSAGCAFVVVQHIARGVLRTTMLGRSAIVKCCTRKDTATPQTCANADTAAHVLCDAYVVPAHGTLAVDGTN